MPRRSLKRPEVLRIIWNDSYTDDGWSDADQKPDHQIISLGFKVLETSTSIVLANSYDLSSGYSNARIYIPKSCILSVRKVRVRI